MEYGFNLGERDFLIVNPGKAKFLLMQLTCFNLGERDFLIVTLLVAVAPGICLIRFNLGERDFLIVTGGYPTPFNR